MKRLFFASLLLACSASPCRAAGLQLSIQDGRVSIDAQDVTIRQILAEWSRVGQTRIVNVERLGGGPISIKFDQVPERQALNIILRNVPGYIAAPRLSVVANTSTYETILIMTTTTAVAAIRPPGPGYAGLPGPGANVTQLRQGAPLTPGVLPERVELADPAEDQQDDPAIAAAAAAGLVMVPALMPGPGGASAPLTMPGGIPQSAPSATAPNKATPSNPWNAPIGTSQPSLAPAPPPRRPTQPADR
ncbi:MAG: hypothetical protein EXQ55_06920 [Acidobacteria bacterium]|nr:hypothetical protein [Acidobacteriota bacterium]